MLSEFDFWLPCALALRQRACPAIPVPTMRVILPAASAGTDRSSRNSRSDLGILATPVIVANAPAPAAPSPSTSARRPRPRHTHLFISQSFGFTSTQAASLTPGAHFAPVCWWHHRRVFSGAAALPVNRSGLMRWQGAAGNFPTRHRERHLGPQTALFINLPARIVTSLQTSRRAERPEPACSRTCPMPFPPFSVRRSARSP